MLPLESFQIIKQINNESDRNLPIFRFWKAWSFTSGLLCRLRMTQRFFVDPKSKSMILKTHYLVFLLQQFSNGCELYLQCFLHPKKHIKLAVLASASKSEDWSQKPHGLQCSFLYSGGIYSFVVAVVSLSPKFVRCQSLFREAVLVCYQSNHFGLMHVHDEQDLKAFPTCGAIW